MPAEWSPHSQCWMMWPTGLDLEYYPNTDLMRAAHAETANHISHFEPVTIIANEKDVDDIRNRTEENVSVMSATIDDSWCRDSGPTFITDGNELAGLDWTFNNYGEFVGIDYKHDAEIAEVIIKQIGRAHV